MAGIIETQIDQTDPLKSISGIEAETRTLTPETDTVAGQVNKVIAEDSPLMQGARTRAAQTANSRGLINSSMAVQAGEEAVHNTALPIAAADASAYNQQGQLNQAAKNRASEVTANATNTGSLLAEQGRQAMQQQTLKGTQAQGLADTEALYKTLLQSSASASNIFDSTSRNIAAISANAATSPEFKQAAIAQQTQMLQASLAVIGAIGNLDLNALLTF